MSDLYNDFPSWGETGAYPQDGFFYQGGDQVNEKHMDALWNGVKEHIDNLNTAIRDRVRDLHGDIVLDQGLVASTGADIREVDVTASSDGAYVSGQYTGSISAQSTSHTANSGSSTRTDTVYLEQDGSVSKSEGTSSAPADTLKIAEVDVATDDTISDVRNYARDHAQHVASENQPSGNEPADLWHDLQDERINVWQNGAFRTLVTEEDDVTFTGSTGINGGGTFDPVDGYTVAFSLDESVIKDGGAKEIDAAEFDGSSGSSGEVLTTDGNALAWSTVSREDDDPFYFGADEDIGIRYDATADTWVVADNTNTADRLELDRTSGNLDITGELTENASL
jgi:hypothetical protein